MLSIMEKKSQPDSESEELWKSLQKALEVNKMELMEKLGFFQ